MFERALKIVLIVMICVVAYLLAVSLLRGMSME